jgi:hypothetical protein
MFLCTGPLTMCRCSPILKSLAASLMIHFESSRERLGRNTPKQLEAANHLIRYLGKVMPSWILNLYRTESWITTVFKQITLVYCFSPCVMLLHVYYDVSPLIINIRLLQSGLLPPPLRYLSELFHIATSYEVYLLLLSVWRYMKVSGSDLNVPIQITV